MSNIILSRTELSVLGINRMPNSNELSIDNTSNTDRITKQITYIEATEKVDPVTNKQLYYLPLPDLEIRTPKTVKVESIDSIDESGNTLEPAMINKVVQEPLLVDGVQVFYYPQTITYEEVETGQDTDGNPIYETVETINVSPTPIYCYSPKEIQVQKELNGKKLYWKSVTEDEITYEKQEPIIIDESDSRYVDGLEKVYEDVEKTKTVSVIEEPTLFTYEDLKQHEEVNAKIISVYKNKYIDELNERYEQELNSHFTTTIQGQTVTFKYDLVAQNRFMKKSSVLANDPSISSVEWGTSVGFIIMSREEFLSVLDAGARHEESLAFKFLYAKANIENSTTKNEIDAIVASW